MKMTRKILPALAMLIVSAIMLSTASFAWFAQNNTVEASGMNVMVQSAAKFLQINNQATDHESDDEKKFSDKAIAADTVVPELDLVHAKIEEGAVNWYTAKGANPDSYGADADGLQKFTGEVDGKYARVDDFYLRMSEGSADTLKNLIVGSVTVTAKDNSLAKALRVLVVGPNGSQIWSFAAGADSGAMVAVSGTDVIANEILIAGSAGYQPTHIAVYTYFDGEDESAFTDNTKNISNAVSVKISFTEKTT